MMESSQGRAQEAGLYPIRAVSARTGVNPVTLRAWERRYGLIKPQRTAKGHRLYSEADIHRIEQILALLDQGVAIGQARTLLDRPQPAATPVPPGAESEAGPWETYRQRMLSAVERFDDRGLDAVYNDALSLYPLDMVSRQLIRPLLQKVGEIRREAPERIAEGSFLHTFLRNKLGARFHQQSTQVGGHRLLAACLPGPASEIELLLFSLSAMTHGFRILLLGNQIPLDLLPTAAERGRVAATVLFGEGQAEATELEASLRSLVGEVSGPVFVGGDAARNRADQIEAAGAIPLPGDWHQAFDRIREKLPTA